jgi:prepilin-type N-terminal cleavage/methylation domain-containing protein/prepilin-type processing-associated H-X9-DG protein
MKTPPNYGNGFTLLELLVVMAIILLLSGILLPAVGSAREQARMVFCGNNIRQIMTGIFAYSDDFHNYFPWGGMAGRNAEEDWVYGGEVTSVPPPYDRLGDYSLAIHPELGSIFSYVTGRERLNDPWLTPDIGGRVFRCPSSGQWGKTRWVTYSMNSFLDFGWFTSEFPGLDNFSHRRGFRISLSKSPSQKVFLVDESSNSVNDGLFVSGTLELMGMYDFHNGKTNIIFLDGHMGLFTHSQFILMQSTVLKRGENFNPFLDFDFHSP